VCADERETTIGKGDGEGASGWLYAAIIVLALGVDYAVFRFVFGIDYVHWYVANGAKLALVLTVFSLAVKLDDEKGLISAHPAQYVGAWFAFFGQGSLWLSALVRSDSGTGSVPFWDSLVAALFSLAWMALGFVWMLVVVPAQYCVTLVCGAPVRLTLSTAWELKIESKPSPKPRASKSWIPVGAQISNVGSTVREKPVTATAAIAAAALFGLGFAL